MAPRRVLGQGGDALGAAVSTQLRTLLQELMMLLSLNGLFWGSGRQSYAVQAGFQFAVSPRITLIS